MPDNGSGTIDYPPNPCGYVTLQPMMIIDGLPPGPISNPGSASLEAIAAPAAVDFLFFVLDCAATIPGQHAFSVTYEEHLAHVERCR